MESDIDVGGRGGDVYGGGREVARVGLFVCVARSFPVFKAVVTV